MTYDLVEMPIFLALKDKPPIVLANDDIVFARNKFDVRHGIAKSKNFELPDASFITFDMLLSKTTAAPLCSA